jgi:hypothetical protein
VGAAALLAFASAAPASALVAHQFDPALSEALEKGVPGTASEAGVLTGRLGNVGALGVDFGHLWIAEGIEAGKNAGKSRADEFDDHSGAWIAPQLQEERSVTHIEAGVAVGHAGGEAQTYIGAGRNGKSVVAVYGPSGVIQPEGIWEGTNTPEKAFEFQRGLAIDQSGNPETQGDVYVAAGPAAAGGVIDVYPGEAGGKEPAPLGQILGSPEAPSSGGHFAEVHSVAISPASGDVLVADGINGINEECARGSAECVVDVFEPAPGLPGTYTFSFKIKGPPGQPFKRLGAMAVDGAGDIYVVEEEAKVVDQFSASGEFRGSVRGSEEGVPFKSIQSVAVDPESGALFVGDYDSAQGTGTVDAFGPSVVLPDVGTEAASGIGLNAKEEIKATLNGTVNPLSEGEASCRFAWGTSEALGEAETCEPPGVLDGASPVAKSATLGLSPASRLEPDTTYFFRMQASNHNGTNPGEASQTLSFTTPGPGIHATSANEVTASSATLRASIDPHGAQTSYYFQYGKGSSFEATVPAVPGESIGAGSGDVQVSPRHIQGLSPSTAYSYRVVAVSELEVEGKGIEAVSFPGPQQSFTTQEAGSSSTLPDGRHWELVSQANKHGALLAAIGETGVIQASSSGSAIAYLANIPTEETVKGFLYEGVQVLGNRGAEGWSSLDVPLAHSSTGGLPVGLGKEYRFFSTDLCTAVVEPFGVFTSLAPEVFPPESERTPYLRHSCSCQSAPASCYEPLITTAPGYGDVPPGTKFGGSGGLQGEVTFIGASADSQHVILASKVALTATDTTGKKELYELSAQEPAGERLKLVSLLPKNGEGKELPAGGAQLGLSGEGTLAREAVSSDGTKVIWSDGEGHLYERDTDTGETAQLDIPEAACLESEECSSEGGAAYQAASSDGARVLFSDAQRLTADAGHVRGKADLYECEIAEGPGGPKCALTDLTPAPGPGRGADVQGALLGTSEEGSWIYFVANGALTGEAGAGDCKAPSGPGSKGEGQCSLYVEHGGQTRLIARLSGEDYPDWSETLNGQTTRVSPNGRYLAFMSDRPLSGYDNRDARSGEADEEVYLYDAAAGRLSCASCNPSGARPAGVEYEQIADRLVGGDAVWTNNAWIAANVPGWTPYRLVRALYQSRYLSDSGRLFFNTNDALVAQDINNDQDVYEFEPAGVGDCNSSSPSYLPAQSGCLALISSGRAAGESAFVDASESGDDVFFLTSEQLVAKDVDTALDLYDAHACSATVPCPEEAEEPPACTTAESCRVAPTPQPSIFGAPSSTTFSGAGNIKPPPAAVKKPTNAQLLVKALKSCRAKYKKQKKRRASCEAQARKRYAPKKAKKASPKKKAGKKGKARRKK